MIRKIIHMDMDAFFASVEQRDNPALRGRPVIVGGPVEKRGVVSTCSYEARVFGIHSGMATAAARRLCPRGVFVTGNMEKYREASRRIFEIFHEYAFQVEPMSIDEAFLDVTENRKNEHSATRIARAIQKEIYLRTGLTASAGVSYNKFLAKVASGLRKPSGLTVIRPEQAEAFLEQLPIEKFHGIGHVTARRLRDMNIRSGRDLKALDEMTLLTHFGKIGRFYYNIVRGVDDRAVEPDSEPKSCGRETTFPSDLGDTVKMHIVLRSLAVRVAEMLKKANPAGARTVTLKVRYGDFRTVTRSISLPRPVLSGEAIAAAAIPLLSKTEAGRVPVRLLGISVGNFVDPLENPPDEAVQLLFDFMRSGGVPEKNFREQA